jgi:hypothetical protein
MDYEKSQTTTKLDETLSGNFLFDLLATEHVVRLCARYGGTEKFHLSGRARQYPLAAQNVCQTTLQ